MVERALFDGLGVALGLEYHQLLLDNVAGIDLGDLHPELGGVVPRDLIPVHPLRQLWVRHRVGLVDALYDGESDDPSLESVVRQGIRHFKIQLCGDVERDGARIRRMAPILGRTTELMVSLDGQESFQDLAELVALLDLLESAEEPARRVCEAIRYVEQPLSRQIALDAAVADDVDRVSARKPLLIDASDDTLSAFKRAVGLGYRGVSSKGCKGLMKALANLGLCQHYSARKDGPRPFLSGEDATCLPIVSLHQELAHLAALGIGHAEAGGGHVAQGLSHLPEAERQACQERHGSLYQRLPREEMTLAVRDGRLDLDSVNTAGLGVGLEIDPETTTPLTGWRPEDLEMSTDV
jgi:hypothetical protein